MRGFRRRALALSMGLMLVLSGLTTLIHPKVAGAATIAQLSTYEIPGFDPNLWDGRFSYPMSVATDSHGDVYVTDHYNGRIQKFDSNGNLTLKWSDAPGGSSGRNTLDQPRGLAIDSSDNLYVGDQGGRRIIKFSNTGALLDQWSVGDAQVLDVAVNATGEVYAVLAGNGGDRIAKYNSTGTPLTEWNGSNNAGPFGFWVGNGGGAVAIDAAGQVYVADFGNDRIQTFDGNGGPISTWGSYGSGASDLRGPSDLAFDSHGDLFVVNYYGNRVQKFDTSGNLLDGWGSGGDGDGQFSGPYGIAVSGSGDIYVADTNNNRIEKFESNGTFTTKWGSGGQVQNNFGPDDVVAGPDGNLWATLRYPNSVARVNPQDGSVTVFNLPGDDSREPQWIVSALGYLWVGTEEVGTYFRIATDGSVNTFTWAEAGSSSPYYDPVITPDGSLWVSVAGHVAQIHADGSHTDYSSSEIGNLNSGGVVGSDGNIWFASVASGSPSSFRIVRFNPSGHSFTSFDNPAGGAGNTYWGGGSSPLVRGADGNLWFVKYYEDKLTRFDIGTGIFTDFDTPAPSNGYNSAEPGGLFAGPDGRLYYCSSGRMAHADSTTGASNPDGNTQCGDNAYAGDSALSDGSLWRRSGNAFTVIAQDGLTSQVLSPTNINKMATGPDGDLWFTSDDGNIYRVNGSAESAIDYSVSKKLLTTGQIHSGDTVEYEITVKNESDALLNLSYNYFYVYDFVPTWLDYQSTTFDAGQVAVCGSFREQSNNDPNFAEQFQSEIMGTFGPNHGDQFSDLSYCAGLIPSEPGGTVTMRMSFTATSDPVPGQDNWVYLLSQYEDDIATHGSVFDGSFPFGIDIFDEWQSGSWQGYNNMARAAYDPNAGLGDGGRSSAGGSGVLAASGQPVLRDAGLGLLLLAPAASLARRRRLTFRHKR